MTLDHRTEYDDVSGDPEDLFTVQITKDKKKNPVSVLVTPTGNGVGTAVLRVGFSHSQLTAEMSVQVSNDGSFIIAANEEI